MNWNEMESKPESVDQEKFSVHTHIKERSCEGHPRSQKLTMKSILHVKLEFHCFNNRVSVPNVLSEAVKDWLYIKQPGT